MRITVAPSVVKTTREYNVEGENTGLQFRASIALIYDMKKENKKI